ncbi:hypothetical protein [Actinomadura bangladeshensis]|uniref:Uncharacterized protein n=1 Tax=Actinomadura bangladeshensis TaxID=453573 RepID=A0A6L9QK97_9ACTN|nr:hypothetical protein [Actinomadura bangladeshensis]NEA25518.1 hypothetical protein [Actinomadura bangladeshensis]
MELILMLLLPFPLGYLIRDRIAAYLAYVAVHSFAFTFQTMTLTRAWVGGDTRAFVKDPDAVPFGYAAVNLAIYAVGLGLVTLGARLRRRASRPEGVDISG